MDYSWIQISDLHLFDNVETKAVTAAFKKISEKVNISFILVTGDLHRYKDNYSKTIEFLEATRTAFSLNKEDIYIVPGNHDCGDCRKKDRLTYYIQNHIEEDPDCYVEDFSEGGLVDCFSEYNKFIFNYYNPDAPYEKPEQICVRTWKNNINIIHLNTAIICTGDNTLDQIIDIKKLYEIENNVDPKIPSIIIAHHPFSSLHKSHQDYLKRIITEWKVSAYLCGDLHRQYSSKIDTHENSNTTIPCIVCGKTAPETKDSYSDIGCIVYRKTGDNVTVSPYLWDFDKKAFKSSSRMDNDDGPLNFKLFTRDRVASSINNDVTIEKSKNTPDCDYPSMPCIWLPDAEFADGSQARFSTYTNTRLVQEYLRNDTFISGLSAVRGVGKTFILQIMRSKVKKDKLLLPIGIHANGQNNWGTEKIDLRKVDDFTGLRHFGNVVSLWEYCILVYVINQVVNCKPSGDIRSEIIHNDITSINMELKSLLNEKEISNISYQHCTSKKFSDLNNIMLAVINSRGWPQYIDHNFSVLLRLEYKLNEFLDDLQKKAFFILIDKLDQSIAQTSTEMPKCEGCELSNNVSNCDRPERRDVSFCETAECSKDCCYGCEKYLAVFSGKVSGLRIHDEGNKRLGHINVWQYIQQGLVMASYHLFNYSKGIIRVCYTVRQEAFAREDGLFGDEAKKIRKTVVELWYTREEQKKIFYECIKNESNPQYLFDSKLLEKNPTSFELAFVGTDKLCHPYVDGLSESVFDSIYRHSFDRARDIQEYGKFLSGKIYSLRSCLNEKERGEKVKKYIEDYAATLAFAMSDGSTLSDSCYYYEKRKLLPNFWAKTDNFRYLLGYFDKNLLFPREARRICKLYNKKMFGLKAFRCNNQCHKCSDSRVHPFSMLYKMGLLGRIPISTNNEDDIEQDFIHSKLVTYINGDNIMPIQEMTLYVLHPALTKSIDASIHHIGHFKGFIIGKGLRIKKKLLIQIYEEYKSDRKKYENDYFYGGKYGNMTLNSF